MPASTESAVSVRRATRTDLARITEIYNHYVEWTPITFDVQPYGVEEREPWFAQFSERGRYQLFVADRGGELIGYAGSVPHRPKAAYETSAELTIYLAHDELSRGVGPRLYDALFSALRAEDLNRVLAGITLPNERSVRMHEKLGFTLVGTFSEIGRKLGSFWDVAWYEREP
jgi:phosphinothricin acetyltransferase